MAKPDVKKNLLEHSAVKVRLLGEYLRCYLNVISNDGYTEKIKIYDLFCGEGIYKNQGEGSPLVILRAVKDLHFINVARDPVENPLFLERVFSCWCSNTWVKNRTSITHPQRTFDD
jgi:hypothetical protein